MSIIRAERQTYEEMWAIDAYSEYSPGAEYVQAFEIMAQPAAGARVLDAGCGTGKGALALAAAGYQVSLCDITPAGLTPEARRLPFVQACLWDDHAAQQRVPLVEWVYCCDVLEHIPPAFTMLTVARLLEQSIRGVFLSIALQPDEFGAWVGRPLHLTVQDFATWRDQLAAVGRVRECRDLLTTGLYLVTTR